jgi:hypothetical protein
MQAQCVAVIILISGTFEPQDSKDPADVLRSFEEELRKAVISAAKDKDLRQKLGKIAKATFDKDIAQAVSKSAKSAWEYHGDFLDRIALADVHFKHDDDKAERTLWFAACKAVFTKQLAGCKEAVPGATDLPSTEQVYYDLKQAIGRVAKRFVAGATDYDRAGYEAAREAFTALNAKARAPATDPKASYTKQLIEIDRLYPLGTDEQKKANAQPSQILKAAAKSSLDRSAVAPK